MNKPKSIRKDVTRRQFLGAAASAAVMVGYKPAVVISAGQARGPEAAAAGPEELRLINGRIHTMDARNTIARAVTVRNGRFATVGDAAPAALPGARTLDLNGRTVVPGIIDAHNHF